MTISLLLVFGRTSKNGRIITFIRTNNIKLPVQVYLISKVPFCYFCLCRCLLYGYNTAHDIEGLQNPISLLLKLQKLTKQVEPYSWHIYPPTFKMLYYPIRCNMVADLFYFPDLHPLSNVRCLREIKLCSQPWTQKMR